LPLAPKGRSRSGAPGTNMLTSGFARRQNACPSHGSLKTEEKTERQCGQSFEGSGFAIPVGEAVCQFTMIERSIVEQKQIVELVSTERIAVRHTWAIPPGGIAL
jgi:hypothetical protein